MSHLTRLDFGDNACDADRTDGIHGGRNRLDARRDADGGRNDLNLPQDEASSAMTPVLVGIGLVIAVGAALQGYFSSTHLEVEFDEDDEDDHYAMAMDQPASRSETVAPLDLQRNPSMNSKDRKGPSISGTGRSASSPALAAALMRLNSVTAEDHYTSEAEEEGDEERADEEDDHDEDDDGITVDEDGTEWWKTKKVFGGTEKRAGKTRVWED